MSITGIPAISLFDVALSFQRFSSICSSEWAEFLNSAHRNLHVRQLFRLRNKNAGASSRDAQRNVNAIASGDRLLGARQIACMVKICLKYKGLW